MNKMRQYLQLIIDNHGKERSLRAESTESGNVIWMYDIIDAWWGISAEQVGKTLAEFGGADVDIYLNTPGGDVFEGRAIQTNLKRYAGNVTVHMDGLVASAGTTVALGGDKRIISQGARFMIHNSWTLGFGDKNDLQKTVDLLSRIDEDIAGDYAAVTGEDRATITQWMDDETWFSAQQALDHGFAHEIFTGEDDKAAKNRMRWNLSAYSNVPEDLINHAPQQSERPCRDKLDRYLDMIRIG